ncbi:MAG: hypothetical protein LBU76_08415 [Azoarcus sp.]|jgi:thymidine phosphorylase|nr:hypothetical protein [Azoarcus sp.]
MREEEMKEVMARVFEEHTQPTMTYLALLTRVLCKCAGAGVEQTVSEMLGQAAENLPEVQKKFFTEMVEMIRLRPEPHPGHN